MFNSLTTYGARRQGTFAITLVCLVFLSSELGLAQCAMCRRALQSPEGQQMIAAFRGGILFLLAAPLAVFLTVATLAVRTQRRRADMALRPVKRDTEPGSNV